MKKMFWLSIILLILSGFVFAAEYDIRNARWGMTKDDVIKSESQAPAENNSKSVVFEDKLDNKKCYVAYFFQNNQLYCTCFIIADDHSNKDDYITDFKDLKQFLTQKYGNPNSDDALAGNNFSKDDLQNCGLAISMGHLKYRTIWETGRSKITLWLFGENSKIKLTIVYDSKIVKKEPELKDNASSSEKGDYKTFCLGDSIDACKQKYEDLKKKKELPGGLFNNFKSFSTDVANVRMRCDLSFYNGQLNDIFLETSDFYKRDQLDTTLKSIIVDKFRPIFVSLYGEPTKSFGFPYAIEMKNGYTTYAYRWRLEKKIISIGVSKSDQKGQNGNKTIISSWFRGVIEIEDKRLLEEENAKKDAQNKQTIEAATKDF